MRKGVEETKKGIPMTMNFITNKTLQKISPLTILGSGFFFAVVPLILVGLYNHPMRDDFWQSNLVQEYGFWGAQSYIYNNIMGRYFAMFLLSGAFALPDFVSSKVIAIVVIAILFSALYFFLKTVLARNISRADILLATIVILLLYLGYMPSIVEGLFWVTGALMYQSSVVVTLLFIICFMRQKQEVLWYRRAWHYILTVFFLLAMVGSTEIHVMVVLSGSLVVLFFHLFKRKKIIPFHLFLIVCAIFASMVVIYSPGNAARIENTVLKYDVTHTVVTSVTHSMRELFTWIFSPTLLLSTLLFIPLFLKIRTSGYTSRYYFRPRMHVIGFLVILLSSHAAALWYSGHSPDHLNNILYLFFLLSWFFGAYIVFLIFLDRYPDIHQVISRYFTKSVLSLLCLIVVLTSFRSSHSMVVFRDLYSGTAYRFDQQLRERYTFINNAPKNKTVVVEPLKDYPQSLFYYDITTDKESLFNRIYAQHFHLEAIQLSPIYMSPR